MSADPRPLLRELTTTDRRGAVWCAAQCARAVLHLVSVREHRPRRAVLVAEAWATGVDVPWDRLRRVASAAWAAAAIDDAAWANAAYAADAAAWAAYTTGAVAYAADAASYAADTGAYADGARAYAAAWQVARDRHLATLHALVDGQVAPIAPTLADVCAARPGAQVAWDWLQDVAPEPVRVGLLSEALCRARLWRLRWTCPVERAIAERCSENNLKLAPLARRRPALRTLPVSVGL